MLMGTMGVSRTGSGSPLSWAIWSPPVGSRRSEGPRGWLGGAVAGRRRRVFARGFGRCWLLALLPLVLAG
jgi:hypothetical protein